MNTFTTVMEFPGNTITDTYDGKISDQVHHCCVVHLKPLHFVRNMRSELYDAVCDTLWELP